MCNFTGNKKTKKFILVLVLLILFNFCYPKQVKAFDFGGNISKFFFMMETGIINLLNDLFCDEEHSFDFLSSDENHHVVYFTAESIMKGKFILFDADIFKNVSEYGEDKYDKFSWLVGEGKGRDSLRDAVAGWYYSLLNFSIVALLCVLVYVGIRMIISTVSQDKAKYKSMIKDWFVALCLIMVMHYIMIGTIKVTGMITEAIAPDGKDGNQTGHIMSLIKNINENPEDDDTQKIYDEDGNVDYELEDIRYKDDNGTYYTLSDAFKYELLLLIIIAFTFIFAWKYLKREFIIIFLILLGPISCITYPIDKISDGKAQAFNKWLTEFIYNVLVQPFHLLIYIVLVGSAVDLANNNILYGLACLGMIIPAEKFVKSMFGFKDQLGSQMGAFAGGAIASKLMGALGGKGTSGGNKDDGKIESNPVRKNVDYEKLANGSQSDNTPQEKADGDENGEGSLGDGDENGEGSLGDEDENGEGSLGDEDENGEGSLGDRDDTEEDLPDDSNNTGSGKTEKKGRLERLKSAGRKIRDTHTLRATMKYGTSSRGKRWIRRAGKSARVLAKMTGGLAGFTIGLASGKGIAGAVGGLTAGAKVGGAMANKVGNTVSSAGRTIGSTVGDYRDAFRNNEERNEHVNKREFKKFRDNKKEQNKAINSFRKNHEGAPPSGTQLNDEMRDRFELSSFGLSDAQIDETIGEYQRLKGDTTDEEKKEKALNQAVATSQYADRYKGKFEKESEMVPALKALTARIGNEQKAREILTNASKLKGEHIQLPPMTIKAPKQTIETVLRSRGIEEPTVIEACQNCELDMSDIQYISKIEPDNEKFVIKMQQITKLKNQPDVRYSDITPKDAIEAIKIENEFGIDKGNDELLSDIAVDIRKMEKTKKVTTKQRELAIKAVNGELSNNDRNAMTDKEKNIIDKYKEKLGSK